MTTEARESQARPFFSLRRETGIVAKKGNALFPQVIHEPTTFSLDVQNGHKSKLEVTIYPPSKPFLPFVIYETGGGLVEWDGNNAMGNDELLGTEYRTHDLSGDKGNLTLAPMWSRLEDTSVDSLKLQWGAPVTVVHFGSREMHLPVSLPRIVYSFFSPPRE